MDKVHLKFNQDSYIMNQESCKNAISPKIPRNSKSHSKAHNPSNRLTSQSSMISSCWNSLLNQTRSHRKQKNMLPDSCSSKNVDSSGWTADSRVCSWLNCFFIPDWSMSKFLNCMPNQKLCKEIMRHATSWTFRLKPIFLFVSSPKRLNHRMFQGGQKDSIIESLGRMQVEPFSWYGI